MNPALDPVTTERRAALLARVHAAIIDLEVAAPTPADAQLDLASVLFAFGLGVAGEVLGPIGVVEHLEQLLELWRGKARAAAPKVGGRAIH